MNEQNQDALRCADALRQLDSAKKHHPSGPGGQMMGCESYRLIASGFSFYELQNSADHLDRLVAENEEKDALLRQAVEALEEITRILNAVLGVSGGFPPGADGPAVEAKEAITAIRQHLGQKRETG